jgi:hypothetical protein
MFKKALKTLGLFALLAPAAQAAMTDAQLAQAMRADVAKYIATIDAPKILFHWVDASDINPPRQYDTQYAATAPHYRDYVQKQGRRIYNRRSQGDGDIEGPGLYMATDPFVSRAYGGSRRYGLIVGVLKKGARVFVGDGLSLTIAPTILAEIKSRGCTEVDYGYDYLLDTFNPTCNKIKQLLVGADASFADARIYSWSHDSVTGCSSRNFTRDIKMPRGYDRNTGAETFVIYNPNAFSSVFGYTHKSLPSGNAMADNVLSYLKGTQQLTGTSLIAVEQMSNNAIKGMTQAQIAAFSQQNIFGCVR